jgi:radical SAM superfamily enzyme YgiQ (UPF0313 family)
MHYIYKSLKEAGVAVERFCSGPIPYRSVDFDTMLERFPVITSGISYEAGAADFFRWLHRANIPLTTAEREDGGYPVIGAGGAMTYINPLLLSGVCDFIVLGDALDSLPHVCECLRRYMSSKNRKLLWDELSVCPSVLVPPVHLANGFICAKRKADRDMPLDGSRPMLSSWITPNGIFGETLLLELQRGCARNCSYCTLPKSFGKMRYRRFNVIKDKLDQVIGSAHVQKIGLVTPEAGDYPDIAQLLEYLEVKNINVSFASLRLDRITREMLAALVRGGRHSITVAPETGSDSLRFSCGKKFTNELVIEKLALTKSMGIDQVKLYLMVGLPGESDEDIAAIGDLCAAILKETGQKLVLSVGPFIPKPGTIWEKAPFAGIQEIQKKYKKISSDLRRFGKNVPQIRFTSPKEAEEEFNLGWYGYDDSLQFAKDMSSPGTPKNCIRRSVREKTLLELDRLWES